MPSSLKTALLALNPDLYWTCEDAQGTGHITNFGSIGSGGNAVLVGGAQLGMPTLKADGPQSAGPGYESSAFQTGGAVNDGWNAGVQSTMVIGATDSFWLFAVFACFAPPSTAIATIVSQGLAGQFGGFYIAINQQGYVKWGLTSNSGVVADFAIAPFVADGRVHSVGFVRDATAHTYTFYLDGQQVSSRADPTAGLSITHAGSNTRVGNWDQQNQSMSGQYSDIVFGRGTQPVETFAALHSDVYAGNPPPFGLSTGALDTALLQQILKAVQKTFPTTV